MPIITRRLEVLDFYAGAAAELNSAAVIKSCLAAIRSVTSSGSKSREWNQLKADVLNKPVTTLDVSEAACLDVAMLACAAHTGAAVQTVAQRWVKRREVIHPRPEMVEVYERRFAAYRKLYPTVKEVLQ